MKTDPSIILFCDSSSGTYIPQRFANEIDRDCVKGIDLALLDELLSNDDPYEIDRYWEIWQTVLDFTYIYKNGKKWQLHQDGDLWLLDLDNMTDEELDNFGFNDF